ncbi:hypothetical protein [Furfurilactobacillus rossiae]|nr:hypothetical protein [Furfurilactobacillus rossiae]QFR67656.1 hypothetical protein LR814_11305 [Furfurilactobacillus rossiae]QLE60617.1 hypothetical protein LROSRS0_0569 [Furfurilactobacillus rossiae]
MFNRKGKRNAEEHLKTLSIQFGEDQKMVTQLAEVLYQDRTELKEDIDSSWDFLNTLRNKPTELDTKIEQIKIEMDRYQDIIDYAQ